MQLAVHPKPIKVLYEGVPFRSRLEARWARFFDALDEPWLYEYEGFNLPSGKYLPDFWLPRSQTWLELKPTTPSQSERFSCRELCESTGNLVICMHGTIGQWLDSKQCNLQHTSGMAWVPARGPCNDFIAEESERWWPCICPICERFGFAFEGDGGDVCRRQKIDCHGIEDGCFTFDHPKLTKAIRMAQAESFW